ncbi:LysM peptidoglycan-binding domain-containing protein [Beijerinckia indica]|uniref:Peptidoglycan-binding LysM n=1 Tax=Beijerinckia indica subsp. indica (strain ATCC 9039 / DSM 1715 / NCIMB 8712) TaxID=395963 RepID=B2IED6_BEII9|nr:LysM peptidoglycan-binding domain-containing protein [Beijerinckia indica]ACB95534.1 Peptidoglycan-binding LysM [Beijerinckia indica subsp. indica ATCC 9039]
MSDDQGLGQRAVIFVLLLGVALAAYVGLQLWQRRPLPPPPEKEVRPEDQFADLPKPIPLPPVPPAPARPAILMPPPDTQASLPQFDIVRIEASGTMLVAGRAKPEAEVVLLNQGEDREQDKELARVTADAAGFFVMDAVTLQPGVYALSLRMTPKEQMPQNSPQNVAVFLPEPGRGEAMIALAEAGKPTQVLQAPKPPNEAAAASQRLAFKTVDVEAGQGLFVAGQAAPDAVLQLYLNEILLTQVTAAKDGAWSLRVGRGLEAGSYRLRADAMDEKGNVGERAEIPFEVPASSPVAAASDMRREEPASSSAAVIEKIDTMRVEEGDTLWRISMKRLGSGFHYMQIYSANSAQIRDPQKIYPGQILILPPAPPQEEQKQAAPR